MGLGDRTGPAPRAKGKPWCAICHRKVDDVRYDYKARTATVTITALCHGAESAVELTCELWDDAESLDGVAFLPPRLLGP